MTTARAGSSSAATTEKPVEMPANLNQSIGVSLADVLRERIVTAVYPPGMWIRESTLVDEFGYSNGPVREALQLLVSEGLLVRAAWRGVRVVELTDKEIVEIFQLRMALLSLAAELATRHADASDLRAGKQMLRAVEEAKTRGDIDAQMALGRQMSQWLCECSRNARLANDWKRLTSQTRMFIYASLRALAQKKPAREKEPWREVIAAIEARDAAAARLAARHLMERTLRALGLDPGL